MKPPIDKLLLHLLHRASQAAADAFTRECADIDLTPRQFVVLAAIANEERPSQTDIVDRTGVDRSTLADIVKRLVARKLVARQRAPQDKRAYRLSLTAAGEELLARGHAAALATEGSLQAALSVHEIDPLVAALVKLADAAGAPADELLPS